MTDPTTGVHLVTISYDDEDGLEVDWEGMNAYEAWALCIKAADTIEADIDSEPDDE